MENQKMKALTNKLTLSFNKLKTVKIVSNLKYWLILPMAVLLLAIIVFSCFAGINGSFAEGMNIGLDFTGGSSISVQFDEIADTDYNNCVKTVTNIIESKELNGEKFKVGYVQKTSEDGISGIMFRYKSGLTQEAKAVNDEIINDIKAAYPELAAENENFISNQFIGATASQTLLSQAFLATGIACLIILIYIMIRFEVWSGFAAIVALIHDIVIMLALTIVFHIQVNTSIVAAIVTIIGYSINNTIIVFDRVRENFKDNKVKGIGQKMQLFDLVDMSVKETLNRTVNTTITTLMAILVLAIFGVASIREFVLPILFGLIAGTYSSIVFAPSLFAYMKNAYDKSRGNKFRKDKGDTLKKLVNKEKAEA